MKITISMEVNGKIKRVRVDVADRGCAKKRCFSPGEREHRSGSQGVTIGKAEYCCLTRDKRGCPE